MNRRLAAVVLGTLIGMGATEARAQTGVFGGASGTPELIVNGDYYTAFLTGRYNQSGLRLTPGYFTGANTSGVRFNSFFVFNITSMPETVFSLALRLNTGNVTGGSFFINFFDFTGAPTSITGGGTNVANYTDLGSGVAYATRFYTSSDNGQWRNVNLGNGALTSLETARKGGSTYFVIGASEGPAAVVTPEPISLILVGSGLAGIGAVSRRRRAPSV